MLYRPARGQMRSGAHGTPYSLAVILQKIRKRVMTRMALTKQKTSVIPAQAGIQWFLLASWIPACTGMTGSRK